MPEPWAYLLTFACYGERLHGDERGSVDPAHNGWRTPYIDANPNRQRFEQQLMPSGRAHLSADSRDIVLAAIQSVTEHESWTLHAAHVRSTHVHAVVTAGVKPEMVIGKLKSYSSRTLNDIYGKPVKRWSRQGSTVYVWDAQPLARAVEYVVHGQGAAMSSYINPNP